MSYIDWIVLSATLLVIIIYGVWKSKGQSSSDSFLRAGQQMPWHVVLLGIMATQASAITFISGPGQAYADGMRFVQYYFGLPLAMIVISVVFVPIFARLNVFTAYEYLDKRFDRRTRLFTGFLFLFSRGVSTGISVYAPSIVFSTIFGWDIYMTNVLMGGLLIIYSYTGGAQAIAHTQKIQFTIILISMAIAGWMVIHLLPDDIGLPGALKIAGKSGKLNVITTDFDLSDRYNIWSGVIGGFFLALSYFGTDQSQVGRYLTAKSMRESRLGLLLNGFVKIPMQFGILLVGALLFSFYTLHKQPLFFNESAVEKFQDIDPEFYNSIETQHNLLAEDQQLLSRELIREGITESEEAIVLQKFQSNIEEMKVVKGNFEEKLKDHRLEIGASHTDTNYVFLHFVQNHLPVGMVGLIFAIIFLASWGSISAAINSLASSTLMDFHKVLKPDGWSDQSELRWGRIYTLIWGVVGIAVAMFATKMGSLIEAVNELGSLFYGAILGIFLTAFFLKKIKGKEVFYAALLAEVGVLIIYINDWVSFLWLNVIGAGFVIVFSLLINVVNLARK